MTSWSPGHEDIGGDQAVEMSSEALRNRQPLTLVPPLERKSTKAAKSAAGSALTQKPTKKARTS